MRPPAVTTNTTTQQTQGIREPQWEGKDEHGAEPCCYCTSCYVYNVTHLQTHQARVNLLNPQDS